MSRTRIINIAVVVVVLSLIAWIVVEVLDEEEASTDGPVIANEGANGYDTAGVTGSLRLRNGCLTIDEWVVVFPYGTSWDADDQAVEFGGEFDDSESVSVGATFRGGGGYYEGNARTAFVDVVQEAVDACIEATGLSGVVLAHPG